MKRHNMNIRTHNVVVASFLVPFQCPLQVGRIPDKYAP